MFSKVGYMAEELTIEVWSEHKDIFQKSRGQIPICVDDCQRSIGHGHGTLSRHKKKKPLAFRSCSRDHLLMLYNSTSNTKTSYCSDD